MDILRGSDQRFRRSSRGRPTRYIRITDRPGSSPLPYTLGEGDLCLPVIRSMLRLSLGHAPTAHYGRCITSTNQPTPHTLTAGMALPAPLPIISQDHCHSWLGHFLPDIVYMYRGVSMKGDLTRCVIAKSWGRATIILKLEILIILTFISGNCLQHLLHPDFFILSHFTNLTLNLIY